MGSNGNMPNFNVAPPSPGNNPNLGGNNLPQYNVGPNTTSNTGNETLNNNSEFSREQLSAVEQLAQPSQVMPVQTQQPVTQQPTLQTSQPVTPAKPVDTAQLEKEWVGKAKTVISANQSDPYELAHQVAMLMQGYLRERYGKINNKLK